MENNTPEVVQKKKGNGLNWLLWWRVDGEELKKHVDGYNTLGLWKSARGVSFLLTLLTLVITVIFSLDMYGVIDAALLVIFVLFIYRGHKWAAIAAMILWTIEKIYAMTLPDRGSSFMWIIWWAIYMHAFFLAYKVEKARQTPHAA